MKKPTTLILLLSVLLTLIITSAFAWYTTTERRDPAVNGSMLSGYFERGEGTKDDPYIISAPIHVYNLAWLQYMGEFNKDSDGDGTVEQFYFKVKNDIDMNGLVIPPIGTKQHPFIGNFNGGKFSISNMTVSNYLSVSGESKDGAIVQRPLTVTNVDNGYKVESTGNTDIVGFFGVVGDFDGSLDDKIADDSSMTDVTGARTPDDKTDDVVNAVYDLFLDGVSVRTESDNSLIGLFAGYVNGTAENVGIGESSIYIGASTAPLTAAQGLEMEKIISTYSLVGAIKAENVDWSELPTGSDILPGGSDGSFGGSIDMNLLAKRMTYMYSENVRNKAEGKAVVYDMDTYPTSRNAANMFKYYQPDTQYLGNMNKNTVLPLNADTKTMIDDATETTFNIYYSGLATGTFTTTQTSGYQTAVYRTNSWYSKQLPEIVSAGNTGYVVGGGTADGQNSGSVRLRVDRVASSGIYKSIASAKSTTATVERNNFDLLTIGIDSNTYKITDYTYDENSGRFVLVDKVTTGRSVIGSSNSFVAKDSTDFKRYDDVISNFVTSMSAQSDKTLISGLRFYGLQAGLSIGSDNKFSSTTKDITAWLVDDATGKLTKHENYEVAESAINFHLSSPGYITAIAGTYVNSSKDHEMFQLYRVKRENNQITEVEKIDTVWVVYEKDEAGNDVLKYIEYNRQSATVSKDGTTDGRTCIKAYDSAAMSTLTEENAAYYYEIPVLGGDYVLGSRDGSNDCPYLLYLDIGANGDINLGEGSGAPGAGPEHTMNAINFVDDAGITAGNASVEAYPMVTFLVSQNTGTGTAIAQFNRMAKNTMTYSFTSTAHSITYVVDNNTPTVTTPVSTAGIAGGVGAAVRKRRRTAI